MSEEQEQAEAQTTEDAQDAVALEEAESKTGIRDAGTNEEAIESVTEGDEEAETQAVPSFFVEDSDLLRVEVDVLFDKENGKLVSISKAGAVDPSSFKLLGHVQEWFDFRPVSYEQMSNYRQRASTFRRDAGRSLVDPVALRNFFVVWHLKDWSIRDRQGNKVELKHNERGALDDDSIDAVYKANPTMLDVVLTLFEKDMMM